MLKSKRTARVSSQKARLDACRWNWVLHRRRGYRLAFLIAGKHLGAVLDSEAGERRSRVVSAIQERDAGACSDRPVRAVLYRAISDSGTHPDARHSLLDS